MLKKQEKNNPTSCWNKADDDEPIFVLLARDPAAPAAIICWADERVRLGKNKPTDQEIIGAKSEARTMHKFRMRQWPTKPGYYWVRTQDEDSTARIVQVQSRGKVHDLTDKNEVAQTILYVEDPFNDYSDDLENYIRHFSEDGPLEWRGPIEEPRF